MYSNSSITLTLKAKLFNRLPARLKLKLQEEKSLSHSNRLKNPANEACGIMDNILVPLFLIPPVRSVVDSEFKGLALATQHGAAVTHTGHHQLNAVSQQGHSGGGSSIYPRYYREIKGNIRGGMCNENSPHKHAHTQKKKSVFVTTAWCVSHSHIHKLQHEHMGGKS